ncbi:uncharacterized protein PFL1_00954 [Pseudozyma flocculosa PF-1]|uniref:Related to Guanine nucleotide-binding protein beta 5 n=1 Tax=Pseudozyma flocculosa TaxID=84751 RepID=A0A5C3FAN2_9BASI|nr:uncharacterized protein PFL1_00954 [Pseudozyma flocculosa PF-1]EPQ31621.1 hypothetical protein PFL1_00954 [Pseudozyma flocculosa PF-1]SPO40735.1 related to Guanine nucleotide-binding protein beta 5 [Pseudozyma flocculosa]
MDAIGAPPDAQARPEDNDDTAGGEVLASGHDYDYHHPQPPAVRLEGHQDGIPVLAAWQRCSTTSHTASKRKRIKLDDPSRESMRSEDQRRGGPQESRDFYRRATWSPDGTVLLAQSESHRLSVFRLEDAVPSPEHHTTAEAAWSDGRPARLHLNRETVVRSPTPVLDAIWYPLPAYAPVDAASGVEEDKTSGEGREGMDQHGQDYRISWCFAHSCRDMPTRLVDGTDGSIRASYGMMNQVERFVGPHSLAFSPDHGRLYCGDWSQISVISLASPGLNTHSRFPLVQSRSASTAAGEGQRGHVSALAVVPYQHDEANEGYPQASRRDLLACGTFAGTVGLYVIDPARLPPPQPFNAPLRNSLRHLTAASACLAGWQERDGDGIHQLAFHPLSPHILFVSSRRSESIRVYDTRCLVGDPNRLSFPPLDAGTHRAKADNAVGEDRHAALLATLPRPTASSQQRFWFDIDWAGRMLAAGDAKGCISIWRIDRGRFVDGTEEDLDAAAVRIEPVLKWKAHQADGQRGGSRSSNARRSRSSGSSGSSSSDGSGEEGPGSDAEHKGSWYATDDTLKVWDLG